MQMMAWELESGDTLIDSEGNERKISNVYIGLASKRVHVQLNDGASMVFNHSDFVYAYPWSDYSYR